MTIADAFQEQAFPYWYNDSGKMMKIERIAAGVYHWTLYIPGGNSIMVNADELVISKAERIAMLNADIAKLKEKIAMKSNELQELQS